MSIATERLIAGLIANEAPFVAAELTTPSGAPFRIAAKDAEGVTLIVGAGTNLVVTWAALFRALTYLLENGHNAANPCTIGANVVPSTASDFCRATRSKLSIWVSGGPVTYGPMISPYVVGLLKALGLVAIGQGTPPGPLQVWLQ